MPAEPLLVYTIGHSTRTLEALIDLLHAYGVTQLADVRTIPRSWRNPQFNIDVLPQSLRAVNLEYAHIPELGGLRHPRRDSPNTGWKNAGFRGFADYMQKPEFATGLERLMEIARLGRAAIMCAEAVPWRCHRSLIADALAIRGARVEHILSGKRSQTHTLTPFARVRGFEILYPGLLDSAEGIE